jgi:Family of unknown function (DUF6188)
LSDVVITEVEGAYALPLTGFVCSGLEDGYLGEEESAHIDLVLHDDPFTQRAIVRIGDGKHRSLILELVARRAQVVRIIASNESTLIVEFDQGESVEVPSGRYEAWEVNGTGFQVIAPAGGGEPMIWDSTSKRHTSVIRAGEPLPQELSDLFGETKGDDT